MRMTVGEGALSGFAPGRRTFTYFSIGASTRLPHSVHEPS